MSAETPVFIETDRPREQCALVGGIFRSPSPDSIVRIIDGLDALQHRGEEAAGIAYVAPGAGEVRIKKDLGLRKSALPDDEIAELPPVAAVIGHDQYSTSGRRDKDAKKRNVHPFGFEGFAIAHNGNTTLKSHSHSRESPDNDTYLIGERIAAGPGSFENKVVDGIKDLDGAYMLLFLTDDGRLYCASDPWGFKPGAIGVVENGDASGRVFASETIGLQKMGARFERFFPRGTFAEITPYGIEPKWVDPRRDTTPRSFCSFETSYFQDTASQRREGLTNHTIRVDLGKSVAEVAQPTGKSVVPVPNSGISYADGVSYQLGRPVHHPIQVNRFTGRNFTKPHTPEERMHDAFRKFSFIPEEIDGQELIVVDDSFVRGSTTQGLVLALFELGASRIELMSGMPAIKAPCNWGIDFPTYQELVYNQLVCSPKEAEEFEHRFASWLVTDKPSLADRINVTVQPLDRYISIIEGKPFEGDIEESGGCYHCVSGVAPRGTLQSIHAD